MSSLWILPYRDTLRHIHSQENLKISNKSKKFKTLSKGPKSYDFLLKEIYITKRQPRSSKSANKPY
jgi:hypothetical protein